MWGDGSEVESFSAIEHTTEILGGRKVELIDIANVDEIGSFLKHGTKIFGVASIKSLRKSEII